MYLILIACQAFLVTVISANPFHKYPYVFLLDIGNEELTKTNTEQIRVSVPGGSLALRYPAIGDGDTIAHVRVSGIDFGTDLKANIVDGGPGSKYVVIVFAGNQGTPYDAVMTIQTVSDEDLDSNQDTADVGNNDNNVEDNNDSAEDTNDTSSDNKANSQQDVSNLDSQSAGNTNAEIRKPSYSAYGYTNSQIDDDENADEEIRQPSYNAYSYTNSDTNDDNDNTDYDDDTSNNKDIHEQYSEANQETQVYDKQDRQENQYTQDNNEEDDDINDRESEPSQVEPEHSDFSDDYGNDDNAKGYNTADSIKYTKYQSLMPKLYGGVRIYPQNAVPLVAPDNYNSVYDSEDPNEVDQTFNDEELHNSNPSWQSGKNKDSNNNFYDSNDASAVES